MKIRLLLAVLFATLLAACVSHEGTYLPGCAAYVGSKITLSDGQFVWEKFTDEVLVNEDGGKVNQFPGYPLRGSYRIDGQMVRMKSAAGAAMPTLYLARRDEQRFLMTADEFSAWETTGKRDDCTLQLILEN
ncbi:MAG: hypothetical protein OEM60_05715 [Gammaproteobacteria bacterium]|nr:hypothetical protein [Gammaproteobacteria bacterium]MDH3428656.1 hypothetical protein [Gammaproteobacteria bacterium]MDH3433332.1 hypothetical protein [Gammaproteobacteria bacterium]